ncbi:MAG: ferritin-like domain-containing protein [Deltaproteobacteria bacterium]|nr:ferritin-like domain-containing protein [Deltaproteobacteria bacterium]
MESTWENYLNELISSDCKHYLWLRSLSYLEYIGYRKMVKAVPYQAVEQGIFHHLSDEIEHSFLLKEQAEKSFPDQQLSIESVEELMDIAEAYFQTLDKNIKSWVCQKLGKESVFLCYLLVSYTTEKRAMSIYPQYYSRLTQSPLKIVIQKIIKDESEHLRYLENILQNIQGEVIEAQFSPLEVEQKLFDSYLNNMKIFGEKLESKNEKIQCLSN